MTRRIQAFVDQGGVVEALKTASNAVKSTRSQPRNRIGSKGAGRWTSNPVPPDIIAISDVTVHGVATIHGVQEIMDGIGDVARPSVPGLKDESNIQWVSVKKFDAKKGIAYGLVYEPNRLDSQGEFMTPENVELMAHRFLQLDLRNAIDTLHDETSNDCYPVESYIARDGDPDFPVGGWVVGIQLTPTFAMKYETGELNGFSFGALVTHTEVDIEYDVIRDMVGSTEVMLNHSHIYFVQLNDAGRVVRGYTSVTMAHSHDILRASVTEMSDQHVHRYFM